MDRGLVRLKRNLANQRADEGMRLAQALMHNPTVPLSPYNNMASPGPAYKEAVAAKLAKWENMQWDTLIRAHTPEFREGDALSNYYNAKPPGTDWFT